MPYSPVSAVPTATAFPAWCTRSPTPRCSPCARPSSTRTSPCSTNTEAVALNTNDSGGTVTEVVVERDGERETYAADIVVVSCGAANTAKLLLAVGQRQAPERARQRLRPGRAQLHVPRQLGGARAVARGEPDGVPEDARAQRLLLRLRRLRVSARKHPDGRQVAGPDVPGREAGRDEAGPRVDARADRPPRGRLLALDRGPAAAREPGHGRRRGEGHAELHRDQRDEPRNSLYGKLSSMLGHLGMHSDHLSASTLT